MSGLLERKRTIAWAAAILTVVALAVRVPLLPHQTGDYVHYVSPWYDTLKTRGFAGSLSTDFSNYTPPYLYLLWVTTLVPIPKIIAIKGLSIVFDVLLAMSAAGIVYTLTRKKLFALAAYGLVLFAPTVLLNSAAWGQCDAMYVTCMVLSVVFVLRGRPALSILAVGIGLAFKVQAIFLVPWLIVLTVRGRIPLRAWLLLPVPYVVAIIPAWLAGRPLPELFTIYRHQADAYNQLTMNAPSVYAWIDARQGIGSGGVVVAFLVVGAASLACWRWLDTKDDRALVRSATMFLILVPFVLPHMHERYFFPADVMAVVYAVLHVRRWYLPVLVITASTLSYWPFLYGSEPVPLEPLAALMAIALAVTTYDVFGKPWQLARARTSSPLSSRPPVRST